MTDGLTIHHLWITIEATTAITLPPETGPAIRGALVSALRRHYCPDATLRPTPGRIEADAGHRAICPVCWLIAMEDDAGTRGRNIQRPYTIQPLLGQAWRIGPGEKRSFGLSLIGQSINLFPYLVLAIPEMGRDGVGRFESRSTGRGRFVMREVVAVNPLSGVRQPLLAGGTQLQLPGIPVEHRQVAATADALIESISARGNYLELTFHTPTRIVAGSRLVHRPEFAPLFQRLLERVDGLTRYYSVGEAVGMTDREKLLALADRVTLVDDQTRWVELASGSRRLGRTTPVSGYQGRAIYHAEDWAPLLPWLLWGQSLHVGKSAVKGNGWFTIAGCPGWPGQPPPTDQA